MHTHVHTPVRMSAPMHVRMSAPMRVRMSAPMHVRMSAPMHVRMAAHVSVRMLARMCAGIVGRYQLVSWLANCRKADEVFFVVLVFFGFCFGRSIGVLVVAVAAAAAAVVVIVVVFVVVGHRRRCCCSLINVTKLLSLASAHVHEWHQRTRALCTRALCTRALCTRALCTRALCTRAMCTRAARAQHRSRHPCALSMQRSMRNVDSHRSGLKARRGRSQ